MSKLSSFRERRVLITGASSGIGRSLALRLAAEGARIALVARREAELEALAEEIRTMGSDATFAVADIAERAEVEEACRKLTEAFGGIDILVNNAGYGHHRRFLDWDVEDMERMMRVNYLGSLYATKALIPQMVERGEGWCQQVRSGGPGRIHLAGA